MGHAMIEIRPAKTWEECIQCEDLQRSIWLTPNGTDVVPASLLITALKNGGLLLGAFEDHIMIGFVFGFLGVEGTGRNRILKHCSHMLAVLPEYRKLGIGRMLKIEQRAQLFSMGLELATWTYDPLQAANAKLNVKGLGAIARRYLRDAYGEMVDAINAGIASDRFEAEWWLNSPRVRHAVDGAPEDRVLNPGEPQDLYRIHFDDRGLPSVESAGECSNESCRLEIPFDLNALKLSDLALARSWREWTRESFESAFAKGYVVVNLENWQDECGRSRIAYILVKKWRADSSQVDLTHAPSRV